jgi:anti-sigma factor RsiW
MKPECAEFENRLLDPEDVEARQHLDGCPACAAELASLQAALGAVQLPERSAAENAQLAALPAGTQTAWRLARARRFSWQGWSTLGLVAAAAAFLVILPQVRPPALPPAAVPASQVSEGDPLDPVEMIGVAFSDDGVGDDTMDDALAYQDIEGVD